MALPFSQTLINATYITIALRLQLPFGMSTYRLPHSLIKRMRASQYTVQRTVKYLSCS